MKLPPIPLLLLLPFLLASCSSPSFLKAPQAQVDPIDQAIADACRAQTQANAQRLARQ
jgi:hypothetical protein